MRWLVLLVFVLAFSQCKRTNSLQREVDNDTLYCFSDTISMDMLKSRGICLNEELVRHWGSYGQIENVDTIFKLLVACDFSPEIDKRILPVYVYIMGELADSPHVDGYVGEYFCDKYYILLRNHPGCLLEYLRSVEADKRMAIYDYLHSGIDYADISQEDLYNLLEHYTKTFYPYKDIIDEFKERLRQAL